ncbi:glycoside hydrolase family 2 TIM barrel-domain containing protein [Pinibacter aurantiacus]|uniref:DUF4982 domain-containing protein n=1 Tax=Pinibacter aurantiacus TaxID=2851599 RepID=A0A9E2SDS6_9BACT|nr:glycoside hydrolase family 2 TIM barrel-domain containing protein [Pinibacter aurantiacus]MBV4358730.1 DUF4982 domain-containing protein [Pinibacter aurantiacus]
MKGIVLFLCCAFIVHTNASAQKKVEGRKQLFDYDWTFFPGEAQGAQEITFNDAKWRRLDLPHDWSIEGTVSADNPSKGAGGYFPNGIGWYRKSFFVPNDWAAKKVAVYFEGVYMNAEVFINGKSLGMHPYGYTSFYHDLSPYLMQGKENVIAVRVDNSQEINSRWYSGSGIYRHVWMMVTERLHVAQWGVTVAARDVAAKQATVEVRTLVKNETSSAQKITIGTILHSSNSDKAGSDKINITLGANSEQEIVQNIIIKQPQLWSPQHPFLYAANVSLSQSGKITDETKTDFGIRTIEFSAKNGFVLNGKAIKISGGCVHHDNGCLGAVAYDRAEERKVELLKQAGFNAVRTSHNPPSEAFLEACDRLGLLVMEESFDCWQKGKNINDYGKYFDDWWRKDMEAMIVRDRNHPSVFMWSIGNEIVERGEPKAISTAEMLLRTIKKLDTTRPVTSAVVNFNKWENLDSLFAVHDVAGYNYHLNAAPADHLRAPDRIVVQTESYPKDAFANWKLVQDHNFIIGDFVWTAIDYLGEAGIGRNYYSGETPGENWENDMFPWHGAYCGDIDLIGNRKPISYYRSMLYNDREKLYMAVREPAPEPLKIKETWWSVFPSWESWNWPGFEEKPLQVELFSKYPLVRLYLDDKLVGEKNMSRAQEFKAVFSVPFVAGRLKAVGVENDKEVETKVLQTAGEPAKIKLAPDRNTLISNGQDLSFITVDITDKDGILQPNANSLLHFKIEGAGSIVGVANADMKDCGSYIGHSRKAWHGKALVIIKSSRQAGEIKLTATADQLQTAETTILAVN